MKYRVKCTHCISLLMNLKKYANAHYEMHSNDCYIEIDNLSERINIEDLEMYMTAAFKYYERLRDLTEMY